VPFTFCGRRRLRSWPETDFEEIEERVMCSVAPHFLQADFWTGIVSGCALIRPELPRWTTSRDAAVS